MADVQETRDSGVEVLDTDVVDISEDAEAILVRTEDEVEIQVGESAGNPVYTRAEYFVVASIDTEVDEATAMMTGKERIDESSVFTSNEEGEVGGGFIQVEEGEIPDALEQFENEYL